MPAWGPCLRAGPTPALLRPRSPWEQGAAGLSAGCSPAPPPSMALSPVCALQPLLTLENSVTTRFADPGDTRVTVQAACGKSVLQDSKVIRVLGESPGWTAPLLRSLRGWVAWVCKPRTCWLPWGNPRLGRGASGHFLVSVASVSPPVK